MWLRVTTFLLLKPVIFDLYKAIPALAT